MYKNWILKKVFLLTFLIVFLDSKSNSISLNNNDSFDILFNNFSLPISQKPFKYSSCIGITSFYLPPDWTLLSIQVPMVSYSSKFSLPVGFQLESNISSLYIANRLSVGTSWNKKINRFCFGLGFSTGLNLGFLEDENISFSTITYGLTFNPNVKVGVAFEKIAVSLSFSLEYLNNISYINGNDDFVYKIRTFNGYNSQLKFEQRIFKKSTFIVGGGLNYANYLIVSWPAYPINKNMYYIPELNLGLTF